MAKEIAPSSRLPAVRGYAAEVREQTAEHVRVGVQFNVGRDRYGHSLISPYAVDIDFARNADGTDIDPDPIAVTLRHRGGVKPSELNRFAWARWITIAEATARIASVHTLNRVHDLQEAHTATAKALGIAPKKRPGRGGHLPGFYEDIATRYKAHVAEGHRNPVTLIASEDHVSRDTAAGWVREARARRHLKPARKGRAG